jgi:hypothetical protein
MVRQDICVTKTSAQQNGIQNHSSLLGLAEKCQTAATDLLAATQALKSKSLCSKWSTFRAALATAWSEKDIEAMENKLNTFRHQMALEVSLLQRYCPSRLVL